MKVSVRTILLTIRKEAVPNSEKLPYESPRIGIYGKE